MKITKTNDGTKGGILKGKPHTEGGIKAVVVTDDLRPVELEGEEAIITKGTLKSNKTHIFDGKPMKPKEILSELNQEGGGVPILEKGGAVSETKHDNPKYKHGGTIALQNPDTSYADKQSKYYIALAKFASYTAALHKSKLFSFQNIHKGDYIMLWCEQKQNFCLFKVSSTNAKMRYVTAKNVETQKETDLSQGILFDADTALYSEKQIMQPGGTVKTESLFDQSYKDFKIYKDGGTVNNVKFNENGYFTHTWETIPEYSRVINTVKPVKIKTVSIKDKGFRNILKYFAANDELCPVMNTVFFDENVLVSSDFHKLISMPYKAQAKFRGKNITVEKFDYEVNDNIKTDDFIIRIGNVKKDLKKLFKTNKDGGFFYSDNNVEILSEVDGKFPNYQNVFPSEVNVTYTANLYDILVFLNSARYFINRASQLVKFLYGEGTEQKMIGFNEKKFREVLTFLLQQGYTEMNFGFNEPNNAMIIYPQDKTYNGYSDKYLQVALMPMSLSGSYNIDSSDNNYQEDVDFYRRLDAIYDFSKGQILSAGKYMPVNPIFDKPISDFKQGNIPQSNFSKFEKITSQNSNPNKTFFMSENNTLIKTSKYEKQEQLSISDAGLSDGIYEYFEDKIYLYADTINNLNELNPEGKTKIGTVNINDLELIVQLAKKLKLDTRKDLEMYGDARYITLFTKNGISTYISDGKTAYIQKIRADLNIPENTEKPNVLKSISFSFSALHAAAEIFDYTKPADVYITDEFVIFEQNKIQIIEQKNNDAETKEKYIKIAEEKNKISEIPELAHNNGEKNFNYYANKLVESTELKGKS